MTDKQIIIDGTHCKYAHFDGGNTQRLLCAIDDCFCDCYRENECYYKQLKRKEQECENYKKQFKADTKEMEDYQNEITRHLESIEYWQHQAEAKEQECERLKWYLNEIRDDELKTIDIEWDEYETHSFDTEYSNIINLVEEALEERSPEDCRYGK